MVETLLANGNGEILPETFHFLHVGWFIVHLIAIPAAVYIGFLLGKKSAATAEGPSSGPQPQEPPQQP